MHWQWVSQLLPPWCLDHDWALHTITTQPSHCGGGAWVWTYKLWVDKQMQGEQGSNWISKIMMSWSLIMADNLSIPLNLYIKKLRMLGLGWPYQDIHVLSRLADWLVSGPGMLSGCHHIPGSRVCRRWQVLIRPRLQTAECQETYADLITVHCGNAAKLANSK